MHVCRGAEVLIGTQRLGVYPVCKAGNNRYGLVCMEPGEGDHAF